MKQMKPLLFVGDKPSHLAHAKGITWTDGKLAAKQLFDALSTIGIPLSRCSFINLFGMTPDGDSSASVRLQFLKAIEKQMTIVAMGKKVSRALLTHSIEHLQLVH